VSRRPLFPPVFEPTESHALIDDFTLRAQRLRTRQQPPGVQSVFPVPKRSDAIWSGSSELGNEALFARTSNNRQMILKMEEWGEPEIRTVTLGMNYDRSLAVGVNTAFTVVAEIQFGAGGTTQVVEVDWRQGASVSLVANTIVVNATYPFQQNPGASVPADLLLRASIAKKMTAASRPTRSFTRLVFDNASSVSPFVAVPPFAKGVRIYPYTNTLTVTQLQFYSNVLIGQSMGTGNLVDNINLPATQQLESFDFTNGLPGAFRYIPLLEGTRTVYMVWAPGGVPAPPPASFNFGVEYELAL